MKNYPTSFYRCVNVFNNYEKKLICDYNEVDEDFEKFSAEAEDRMTKDNTAFAVYLIEYCKPFQKNLESYSNKDFEEIYLGFYASRFNMDCFSFKGFSEIENTFVERFIDVEFAIDRSFNVKNKVAVLSYYSNEIYHEWLYTPKNVKIRCGFYPIDSFANMQVAFDWMEAQSYSYYCNAWNGDDTTYFFKPKEVAVSQLESVYGKDLDGMPCLIETEE